MAGKRYRKWRDFHHDNPKVFGLFMRFSRQAKAAGFEKFGGRIIGERIRWHTRIETQSSDGYKISNNHWPYYCRLTMLLYPDEFDGFFSRNDTHFDGTDEELLEAHGVKLASTQGALF